MERTGVGFMGIPTVPEMVAIAQRAETLGYESAWVAETRIARDAIVPMTADTAVPLYLGVTGPKALRLAGECADGVLLNGFMSTAYVSDAIRRISDGLRGSGRDVPDPEVIAMLVVSVDEDAAHAKDQARRLLATYLALFPNVAAATGLPSEQVAGTRERFFAAGPDEAARTVPDAWVEAHTVAGTPEECRDRIAEYRAAGATTAVLCPIGPDPMAAVEALAPR
ncbi:MAG: LLM class flavin-dependent oxidoreductase [Streptosporangiales bacterium]|nr:LLM class flavin-dependent oxidoreductase [Streptosporangiales bacterium]